MALTITKVLGPIPLGDHYMTVNKVTFDSSYPTGGEALTATDLGLATASSDDTAFHVDAAPSAGYIAEYDHTNKKVKMYRQKDPAAAGGADIPLPEVGNAVDLSAVTIRVVAYGRFKP